MEQTGRAIQCHQFKIVLLGEGCVGKTSLVLRYVENKFTEKHQSTLQASYLKKSMTVDGSRVTLNIWDTAGQERYHALGPIYYRDSNGALLVYDIADPDSLSKVKTWVKELRKMLGTSVCLAIVGNKIDLLPPYERSNPHSNALIQEAIEYSDSISQSMSVKHYLTSAKLNHGIDETFLDLCRRMMKYAAEKKPASMSLSPNNNRTLRIADDEEEAEGEPNQTRQNKCSC